MHLWYSCAFLILLTDFTRLWQYIAEWERVFRRFDKDHSGTIERRELSDALQSFGYKLSPHLLNLLQHKYGNLHGYFLSISSWLISLLSSHRSNFCVRFIPWNHVRPICQSVCHNQNAYRSLPEVLSLSFYRFNWLICLLKGPMSTMMVGQCSLTMNS